MHNVQDYKSKNYYLKSKINVNGNHYQSSMVREVGLGTHTVRGLLTSTFWQSLVGTVSQISCFFSVHSCLGTILQTGVEISVHFLVGKGKHVSLWTIPAMQHKKLTLIKFMVISMIYITNQKGQMLPRRRSTLTRGIQIPRFSLFKAYTYFFKNCFGIFSPLCYVTFQCGC